MSRPLTGSGALITGGGRISGFRLTSSGGAAGSAFSSCRRVASTGVSREVPVSAV